MKIYTKLFYFITLIFLSSCGSHYLDLQQEKNMRVPNSFDDFQKLLYQTNIMNESAGVSFANIGGDEYWIPPAQFFSTGGAQPQVYQRSSYTWEDNIYVGRETETDWVKAYNAIYRTNLGLDFIKNHPKSSENAEKWDRLKGSALFMRALNFYQLSQVFCPIYKEENLNLPLGLPLREDPDPTIIVPRSTVGDTYKKIVADLLEALPCLPDKGELIYRPSKAAVYALLSRVYMQMGDYLAAEKAADDCLSIQNTLLNFNNIPITAGTVSTFAPNGKDNPEIIYMSSSFLANLLNWYHPDTTLVRSYAPGDLRLKIYFQDTLITKVKDLTVFKGNYKGTAASTSFCGLAIDEIYLNRAESRARNQDIAGALADLNLLRQSRYKPETYKLLTSSDYEQVMEWILDERHKELVMRSTRWSDLRRLNKESKYAITIVRQLDGDRYELKPNSPKWTWPILMEAINNGGYPQNPR